MNKVSDGNRNIRKQRGDDVCHRKQRTHICWSQKIDPFVSPGPTVRPTHPLLIRSGKKVLLKCRTLTYQKLTCLSRDASYILQFLHEAGLSKKWAIADVFGLDPELLAMLEQPVLSLLLLFPINEKVRLQKYHNLQFKS